jgi:5-aminopentanamidase
MKLALWSAPSRLGDVPGNVATVSKVMQSEDDLVVFPEMFLTGYNIGDDVQRLAFKDRDARLEPLVQAAEEHGTHVIVGAPHTPRRGIVYNAALCIDDAGTMNWVHKRALPTFTTFRESLFFTAGEKQQPWYTRFGAIGVSICYDLYFPEFHKRQVLEGADLLVNISASPSTSRRFFDALLPARAIENACFSAYSNLIGAQDGLVFWGGAQLHGPRGEVLGALPAYEEGCVRADIDLEDVVPAREFRPTLRDSLPGGPGGALDELDEAAAEYLEQLQFEREEAVRSGAQGGRA